MVDDIVRGAFAVGAFAVMLLTHVLGLHHHRGRHHHHLSPDQQGAG